jgi:hypothetical protein
MPVGQLVTKQTWLLDEVEVKGIVRVAGRADGEEVGTGDDFDLEPDNNYRHLIASFPANNPLFWNPGFGCIHCETYPLQAPWGAGHSNRDEPWPLDKKPDDKKYEVLNRATDQREPLRVGAHVRIVGRWTIDHHPELCVTRNRGWLRVGCAHTELHPFRWDSMELIVPVQPNGVTVETISVAAPLHEEVYLGHGKWLGNELASVASKVFITDDGSNYHNVVTANASIKAPPLPGGFTPERSLVSYREAVMKNGTGMSLSLIRTITIVGDGIDVTATVTAPGTVRVDGLDLGDVNDPANGRSTFQARYSVGWAPRLVTVERVDLEAPTMGTVVPFQIDVRNRGPDPVKIVGWSVDPNPAAAFTLDPFVPTTVAPAGAVTLHGTFAPATAGSFSGTIVIRSNDPAHDRVLIPIAGMTRDTPASGRLAVTVDPPVIRRGESVSVTVRARDTGNRAPVAGTVRIWNFNSQGDEVVSEHPTNTAFTMTFRRGREWDPERKVWLPGDDPSGVVNAASGYVQDRDAAVPFVFR